MLVTLRRNPSNVVHPLAIPRHIYRRIRPVVRLLRPKQVPLHIAPALRNLLQRVVQEHCPVQVPDNRALQVRPRLSQHLDNLKRRRFVSAGVNQNRRARNALRLRRCPQRLALVRHQRPAASDLANHAGPVRRPIHSISNIANDLPDKVILAQFVHVRRMRRIHIVRRAHDNIHARSPRYASKSLRIPLDADARRIHQRPTTVLLEDVGLVYRRVHIRKLHIVQISHAPMSNAANRLQRNRLVVEPFRARLLRHLEQRRHVYQQMLVRQGYAEFHGRSGPQHRLHLARNIKVRHAHAPRFCRNRSSLTGTICKVPTK